MNTVARAAGALIVALCFWTFPVACAELELRYSVLERILADQIFTQEGRLYVRGNKSQRCQFAYLEHPRIGAENGLLRMTASFKGRNAMKILGNCLGPGDSFDFVLTAAPYVHNGALALKDVKVTTVKESYYIRRVRVALAASIAKDLRVDVKDQAKRLLEQPREKSLYQQDLHRFQLSDVRAASEGLVLVVDFRLVLK
jgi:hypothetical protein